MARLTNGFHKLSIRLEDQYSIRLRKQTKRIPVARPTISGFDGLTENIIFRGNTSSAYRAIILYRGYHCFYQLLRKKKTSLELVHKCTSRRRIEYSMKHTKSSATITHRSQRTTSGNAWLNDL